jgi:hypothetical protein
MADNPKKRDRLSLSERRARGLVAPEDLCYTAMVGEVSLDEDAWTELEKRIKLRLGSDSRAALTRALNDLLENIALRKEIPPSREVREDLKSIGEHAKGLAKLIGRPDRDAAVQIAVHPVVGYDTSIFKRVLWQISTNAQAFKLSRPTGRPRRDAERAFLERVKEVWQEAAGKEGHGVYSDAYEGRLRGDVVEIVTTLYEAAQDQDYVDSDSLPAILEILRPRIE